MAVSGLSVTIVHKSSIDELIRIFNDFLFLKNHNISEDNAILWNMNGNNCYCIQAMFIGKTGYGKSTTLNKICGQELFKTDAINSCTKTVFSAEYKIHSTKNYYFSLCDLPGMGESINSDKIYAKYYTEMMERSHCIIYVMRTDQRDYAKDMEILGPMLESEEQKKKIILAINFVDKIEPVSRSIPFHLNKEQEINVEKKWFEIQKIFNIPHDNIIFYSATEEYNLNKIVERIINIINKTTGTVTVMNPTGASSKKLYVGNLSYDTTEDSLRDYFARFGNVISSKIIVDRETGESKGFGFIEMSSEQEAVAAITWTNGSEFEGRYLRVNEAMDKPRRERSGGGYW